MTNGSASNLKQVAALAEVSVATVSRFLNRSLELPLPTKTRIEEAIKALNYRPNPHARRLSMGRSDIIGLVIPDIANPFFATLVAAVEEAADAHGLAVSLHATLNRAGREIEYLELIARNHVDGLIFATNHADVASLADLINRNGKVVVVDEDVPGSNVPRLFCDNEQGGYLAGTHLAELGHKHIVFIGGDARMLSTRRRLHGVRRALREIHSDTARVDSFEGEYTIAYGRLAAERFLSESGGASAIFASSDEIAIGVIEVLLCDCLRIPEDVSVMGFDDVGPLHLFSPPLTVIRQPVRAIGRRSVELLLETPWADRVPEASEELVPVELIVRHSVGPPRKSAMLGRFG